MRLKCKVKIENLASGQLVTLEPVPEEGANSDWTVGFARPEGNLTFKITKEDAKKEFTNDTMVYVDVTKAPLQEVAPVDRNLVGARGIATKPEDNPQDHNPLAPNPGDAPQASPNPTGPKRPQITVPGQPKPNGPVPNQPKPPAQVAAEQQAHGGGVQRIDVETQSNAQPQHAPMAPVHNDPAKANTAVQK